MINRTLTKLHVSAHFFHQLPWKRLTFVYNMAEHQWLELLLKAEKNCIIQDGKRKVHYKFGPGQEMAEEYSMDTDILLRRAWRRKSNLGGDGQWEVEIGDPEPQLINLDQVGIKESSNSPFVSRRITKTSLEWRIRNLPYPLSVYSVTADPENKCLVVRTSNKKYYKKLPVTDLERIGLVPEQDKIQFTHKHNTLVITYQKPVELYGLEKRILEELKKLKTLKEGDMQCNPS